MKIYTITCHNVYNFGASLQAYALQHYIEELGHDCKIIDYRPEYLQNKYNWKVFASDKLKRLDNNMVIRWPLRISKWLMLRFTIGRKRRFDEFTNKYLKLTEKRFYSFNELESYPFNADVMIAGSDQIWNPCVKNGCDRAFYLDFISNSINKVSYAASFSISTLPEERKTFVKSMLSNFNKISVRENEGLCILHDLRLDGEVVLDPIFLIEKEDWESLAQTYDIGEKYILVYDFEGSELIKKTAKFFKKSLGYKLYSINDAMPRLYADRNYTNVGPLEFLSMIRGCSLFLSNSFHGSAFSLYFNRPFFVIGLQGFKTNTRMENLLKIFGLSDRMITSETNLASLPIEYDFDIINNKIESTKEKSFAFLNNALKTE